MKYQGLFDGQYVLNFQKTNLLTQKRAYIFPGQGSAYAGMFKHAFGATPTLQKFLSSADRLSSYFDLLPVSSYINDPAQIPKEKTHIYRSCALFVVEVALADFFEKQGFTADFATAHSFGECAALVHTGIIDFETMFSIVVHRNLICPKAHELGGMIAVNGGKEKLTPFFEKEGVYLANENSPRQIVLAYEASVKDSLLSELRKMRIPHVLLSDLPQPYHSPLMDVYQKRMKERISQLNVNPQPPRVPFLSGVTIDWITQDNYQTQDYSELLSRQITEPVNFIKIVEELCSKKVGAFYEMGPGKMLESSLRNILHKKVIAYKNAEDLIKQASPQKKVDQEKLARLQSSKWFTTIKEVIQNVTGYKSEDISIDHSFQENLGIDSIKKAEVLFKILNQDNMGSHTDFSTMRFTSIFEAVEYLENYSENSDPLRTNHQAEFTCLTPAWKESPLAKASYWQRISQNYYVQRIPFASNFLKDIHNVLLDSKELDQRPIFVVENLNSDLEYEEILSSLHQSYLDWDKELPTFHLVFLDHSENYALAPIVSLWKALGKETRMCQIGAIHAVNAEVDDRTLINEVMNLMIRDVKYVEGKRYIETFKNVSFSQQKKIDKLKVIAVGGSRGINFEILKRFPPQKDSSLLLIGRSSKESVQPSLDELKKCWIEVEYQEGNAEDYDFLQKVTREFQEKHGSVNFVINSCGIQISKDFRSRKTSDVMEEYRSKYLPLENIERIKDEFSIPKVFHFSSFVSKFGNHGQATYCFNNSLIECSLGENSHAIAWGPWDSVGMTANEGILQIIKERGISLTPIEEGAKLAASIMLEESSLPKIILPIDHKDLFLFATDHISLSNYRGVLGDFQNIFEAVFYKDIYLDKEPWLSDHVVFNRPVIPAAYLLSQLMTLSRIQFSEAVTVRNFRISNMAIIDNGHCHIKLQSFFRAPHEITMYSMVPHCHASFDTNSVLPYQKIEKIAPTSQIDINTLYKDEVFRFGKSFQLIKRAFLTKDQVLWVEIKQEELPEYMGHPYFDFYLALFEAAFQSVTIQTYFLSGVATLPLGIHKVLTNSSIEITSEISIYPKIKRVEENIEICDIFFTNQSGEVFCKIQDFRVRLLKFDTPKSVGTLPYKGSHE